jgi:hypothetical protein
MGGNIGQPGLSAVAPIPSTNNWTSGQGLEALSSYWDNLANGSNWFGGQKHNSDYVSDSGQLMTSVFGPDVAAGLSANKTWNANPANKDMQVTFDPGANQGGWGGLFDTGVKVAGVGLGIADYFAARDARKFDENKVKYQLGAATDGFNAETRSWNKKQSALVNRQNQLATNGTTSTFNRRKQLDKFNG